MKYIKLLFIALVLVGAVSLLLMFSQGGSGDSKSGVTSSCAKDFESQIAELCKDDNWNLQAYKDLQSKINIFAKDGNIQLGEKNSLNLFLYTESCRSIFERANRLFKRSSYPLGEISVVDDGLKFLQGLKAGSNSNLTQGLNMMHEYRTLIACCSFSSKASYSNPLKAFSYGSVESIRGRINSLKYYNSHFSNNSDIRTKVSNLASNRSKAEADYYMNLEKCIEEHHHKLIQSGTPKWEALSQTDKDLERFQVISTNSYATEKLIKFVR